MWGQWIGKFSGTNSGDAILNIDRDKPQNGKISIYDRTTNSPARWASVHFIQENHRLLGEFEYLEDAPPIPGISQASNGTLEISTLTDTSMSGNWSTNIGTNGNFELKKPDEDIENPPDHVFSWEQFTQWLRREPQTNHDLLFRGQKINLWRLKTSFHRTGRFDLLRYGNEDVLFLNHHLASLLNKIFDLNNPIEYGALLNLAQHHGFPTPLLDWTESPYIGAFFAFSDIPKDDNDGYVRIFVLNRSEWSTDHEPVTTIIEQKEYFSIHRLLAIHNPRALPQQSVVTSTNINDIENWFSLITPSHRKYLIKIDIPKSERGLVMHELTKMGITSASLFPGIEGSCKALKEKFF